VPEGNETHRWAQLHAGMFKGQRVQVDSPQGRFAREAGLVDGRVLKAVLAVGKHLGYDFGTIGGERKIIHVHMGLYGDFVEGKKPMPEPRGALRMRMWTRAEWLELRGPTDCSVWNEAQWLKLMARLGPDPLNKDNPARLVERLAARRTPIGTLLMDQSVISGVGNIYRAEVLFRAGISPFRAGCALSELEVRALWKDISTLMPHGMVDRRIVTTRPKDRGRPRGQVQDKDAHYVYRRTGQPCRVCGSKIETQVMAGRNLFWCPVCQAA
jgi:endonuclease-8